MKYMKHTKYIDLQRTNTEAIQKQLYLSHPEGKL